MNTILILGATSTVAADVARIYASRGAHLVLFARNKDQLETLAHQLVALGAAAVQNYLVDFNLIVEATEQLNAALCTCETFDTVLIAHGYLGDQQLSESDFNEALLQIQTNYLSVVAQLIALGNYFEKRKQGQLAVITSVAGDRGRPRNYTYGSAKGALSLYLQGLRSRLWPHVQVTTIKLGPVDTKMTVGHEKNRLFSSSQNAALGIVRAIERGAAEAYVPGYWYFIMRVVVTLPEFLFQRLKFLSARDS